MKKLKIVISAIALVSALTMIGCSSPAGGGAGEAGSSSGGGSSNTVPELKPQPDTLKPEEVVVPTKPITKDENATTAFENAFGKGKDKYFAFIKPQQEERVAIELNENGQEVIFKITDTKLSMEPLIRDCDYVVGADNWIQLKSGELDTIKIKYEGGTSISIPASLVSKANKTAEGTENTYVKIDFTKLTPVDAKEFNEDFVTLIADKERGAGFGCNSGGRDMGKVTVTMTKEADVSTAKGTIVTDLIDMKYEITDAYVIPSIIGRSGKRAYLTITEQPSNKITSGRILEILTDTKNIKNGKYTVTLESPNPPNYTMTAYVDEATFEKAFGTTTWEIADELRFTITSTEPNKIDVYDLKNKAAIDTKAGYKVEKGILSFGGNEKSDVKISEVTVDENKRNFKLNGIAKTAEAKTVPSESEIESTLGNDQWWSFGDKYIKITDPTANAITVLDSKTFGATEESKKYTVNNGILTVGENVYKDITNKGSNKVSYEEKDSTWVSKEGTKKIFQTEADIEGILKTYTWGGLGDYIFKLDIGTNKITFINETTIEDNKVLDYVVKTGVLVIKAGDTVKGYITDVTSTGLKAMVAAGSKWNDYSIKTVTIHTIDYYGDFFGKKTWSFTAGEKTYTIKLGETSASVEIAVGDAKFEPYICSIVANGILKLESTGNPTYYMKDCKEGVNGKEGKFSTDGKTWGEGITFKEVKPQIVPDESEAQIESVLGTDLWVSQNPGLTLQITNPEQNLMTVNGNNTGNYKVSNGVLNFNNDVAVITNISGAEGSVSFTITCSNLGFTNIQVTMTKQNGIPSGPGFTSEEKAQIISDFSKTVSQIFTPKNTIGSKNGSTLVVNADGTGMYNNQSFTIKDVEMKQIGAYDYATVYIATPNNIEIVPGSSSEGMIFTVNNSDVFTLPVKETIKVFALQYSQIFTPDNQIESNKGSKLVINDDGTGTYKVKNANGEGTPFTITNLRMELVGKQNSMQYNPVFITSDNMEIKPISSTIIVGEADAFTFIHPEEKKSLIKCFAEDGAKIFTPENQIESNKGSKLVVNADGTGTYKVKSAGDAEPSYIEQSFIITDVILKQVGEQASEQYDCVYIATIKDSEQKVEIRQGSSSEGMTITVGLDDVFTVQRPPVPETNLKN